MVTASVSEHLLTINETGTGTGTGKQTHTCTSIQYLFKFFKTIIKPHFNVYLLYSHHM